MNPQKSENFCLGYDVIKLNSQVLNEEREIKILLPSDYSEGHKYPVLYITDAEYNFETASAYLSQLIKYNSIPKCILVGINQKERGNELDVFWSENGIKFKNFIFKELIPNIDNNYGTSGFNAIIGHSDGAEYNHLLMLEKDNPFRGFVNISTNLNNDVSSNVSEFFEGYKAKNLYYFIASADYDSEDRIKAGKSIEDSFQANENPKIRFVNRLYKEDHQNVLSKSLLDGMMFVFQDYRNLTEYRDFKDYTENYKTNIERDYGFVPSLEVNDVDYFFGEILDNNDVDMYEYLIDYATKNDILNIRTYDRSWHYYAMGEHSKSIEYWNKTIDDFGDTSPRVFYHNFEKAIKSYLILNDPKGALEFLEKCKNILPQYALEFNYFIAKVALENKIKDRLGKKSLKYCEQNYKENKYFNKEDLDELRGE